MTQLTSVVDPDPYLHWSRIQEGKKLPTKIGKVNKFNFFLWAGCSILRAESFSCSLDVLYGGLGINKLQFVINIQLYFLVIKPWIRISIRIRIRIRIRIHLKTEFGYVSGFIESGSTTLQLAFYTLSELENY